jgi:hypothetical protein
LESNRKLTHSPEKARAAAEKTAFQKIGVWSVRAILWLLNCYFSSHRACDNHFPVFACSPHSSAGKSRSSTTTRRPETKASKI